MISILGAISDNGVVGNKNTIPWAKERIPRDLPHFMRQTLYGSIIEGRNTAESMGFRPLKNRDNIMVSQTITSKEGFIIAKSYTEALQIASKKASGRDYYPISAIGGYKIWEEALESEFTSRAIITRVHEVFEGDAFFPESALQKNFRLFYKDEWVEKGEGMISATLEIWKRSK